MKGQIDESMKRLFNPEFLNRVDETIVFRALTKEDIVQIIQISLKKLLARVEQMGVKVELSPKALEFVADKGFDKQYGARPLRRAMQKYIEDPIAEELLKGSVKEGSLVKVDLAANGVELLFQIETQGETSTTTVHHATIEEVMKEAGITHAEDVEDDSTDAVSEGKK